MTKSNKYQATGEQKVGGEGATNEAEATKAAERAAAAQSEKNVATPTGEATTPGNYELTARERAALEWVRATDPPLRLKLTADSPHDPIYAIPDHPDQEVGWALVMQGLGTTNRDFARGLLEQLVSVTACSGYLRENRLNYLFQFVVSGKPTNELQAALLVQMAQVHVGTMDVGERLNNVYSMRVSKATKRHRVHGERMLALSTIARSFGNLARIFTEQIRLLNELQGGGEQKVAIQNFSVSEGGQAIVGNVMRPERQLSSDTSQNSPPALTRPQEAPMPMVEEPSRTVVPVVREAAKRNGKTRP
jgi:hypothetical protein